MEHTEIGNGDLSNNMHLITYKYCEALLLHCLRPYEKW